VFLIRLSELDSFAFRQVTGLFRVASALCGEPPQLRGVIGYPLSIFDLDGEYVLVAVDRDDGGRTAARNAVFLRAPSFVLDKVARRVVRCELRVENFAPPGPA
jgi:hypothetical protein